MIAMLNDTDRHQRELSNWEDDGGFERFTHRNRCAFPAGSHASKIRGIVRSRAISAARHKAKSFNGVNRRRRRRPRSDRLRASRSEYQSQVVRNRQVPLLTVTLVWLVCSLSLRASAYGIYEEEIRGALNEDAPQLFSQAFITPPPGEDDEGLSALEGYLDLDEGDFADMYCIFIGGAPPNLGTAYHRFTPEQFTVSFVAPSRRLDDGSPRPMIADPQLFLFDSMGHPVVGNDDIDDTNQQASIPLGTVTKTGVYVLAVTGSGYDPADAAMNALFTNNSTGLKMPTNAEAVQAGWKGTHNEDGYYRLRFGVGVDGEPSRIIGTEHWVPEPTNSALMLLGIGGLTLRRMRDFGWSMPPIILCGDIPTTCSQQRP